MSDYGINILVLGKSGVGKSSFCNYIFDEGIFLTGKGKPVTGWDEHFKHYSVDYENYKLNVYDSVGIETDNYKEWKSKLDQFLYDRGHSTNKSPMEWLHGAFYLINAASARIENIEAELIKDISSKHSVPLVVVLTNVDAASPAEIKSIRSELTELCTKDSINIEVTEVCSVSIKTRAGVKNRYGKEETLNLFLTSLDEKLRVSLINYFADVYISFLENLRDSMKSKINESDLGIFNLIKSAIEDTDLEDIINFDTDSLEQLMNERSESVEQLDGFLDRLGFSYDSSTRASWDELESEIEESLEEGSNVMDAFIESVESAFESGGFLDKLKASYEVLKLIADLKGSVNSFIDDVVNPAISKLYKYKV